MTGTWDVRILNASYASDDQGTPYIELFGKTRDRTSITLVVYDFKPYFYIVDPTPAAEEGAEKLCGPAAGIRRRTAPRRTSEERGQQLRRKACLAL